MIFKHKKVIFALLLFLCIFLTMSFISADDNSTANDSYVSSCDDSIVSSNQYKSFDDLDNEINGDLNKFEIKLTDDYSNKWGYKGFKPSFTKAIYINHSVSIDGQGHIIDANKSSRIFHINANNVILKNIIFKNSISNTTGAIYCNGTNITIINSTFINNWLYYPVDSIYINNVTGFLPPYKFKYSLGGVALNCKYDSTIINSTFINNHVYLVVGDDAVGANSHNESISYALNSEKLNDIISFEKNHNVIVINSTFRNEPAGVPYLGDIVLSMDNNTSSNESNIRNKNNSSNVVEKIKKTALKVITKKNVFSKKYKTKKYSVFLKGNNGKSLKNTKITLKIKGKTFHAKTNSNGKVTFKIKKLNKKGTYKGKIIFKGDNTYKGFTKKVTLIVK